MENYWFCTDHKIKLEQYTNRYSGNAFFSIKKDNIDVGLNNAAAVKKIEINSILRGKDLAEEYFSQFPDAEELECVGTVCPKCNKIYVSPRHFKTRETGDIDIQTYNHWWVFRMPVTPKDQQDDRPSYYLFFFRYILYAYLLNYTLFLQMKIFGKYRKVGLYVLFPIVLLVVIYLLIGSRGILF
jgi:hypothetical protein